MAWKDIQIQDFQGIQKLVDKHRIDRILEEEKVSQQTMADMFTFGAYAMTFEFDFLGSFQYLSKKCFGGCFAIDKSSVKGCQLIFKRV